MISCVSCGLGQPKGGPRVTTNWIPSCALLSSTCVPSGISRSSVAALVANIPTSTNQKTTTESAAAATPSNPGPIHLLTTIKLYEIILYLIKQPAAFLLWLLGLFPHVISMEMTSDEHQLLVTWSTTSSWALSPWSPLKQTAFRSALCLSWPCYCFH